MDWLLKWQRPNPNGEDLPQVKRLALALLNLHLKDLKHVSLACVPRLPEKEKRGRKPRNPNDQNEPRFPVSDLL